MLLGVGAAFALLCMVAGKARDLPTGVVNTFDHVYYPADNKRASRERTRGEKTVKKKKNEGPRDHNCQQLLHHLLLRPKTTRHAAKTASQAACACAAAIAGCCCPSSCSCRLLFSFSFCGRFGSVSGVPPIRHRTAHRVNMCDAIHTTRTGTQLDTTRCIKG